MNSSNNLEKDESINASKLLEVTYQYFEQHLNQRLQMLNYFITIEIVLFGAFFASLELTNVGARYVASIAIIFMAILFRGLDYRTRDIIHGCEKVLMEIEDKYEDKYSNDNKVIHYLDNMTERKRAFTYSTWFDFQFMVIGLSGILLLFLAMKGVL